jgi:hypothetical protein
VEDAPEVPQEWKPAGPPGGFVKVPLRNKGLLRVLRGVLHGRWDKVYRYGQDGTEVHYFLHESGKVCLVKHKVK